MRDRPSFQLLLSGIRGLSPIVTVQQDPTPPLFAAVATLAIAMPLGAFAYDEDAAIRDCEKRLRDEYKLNDFRHQSAQRLPGEGH